VGAALAQSLEQDEHTRDLGNLFLSLLLFYSAPGHFDLERHAIDLAQPPAFVRKEDAQAQLDAGARAQSAARLCAIEPVLRHDVGAASYKIGECFAAMGALRLQMMHGEPLVRGHAAVVEEIRVRVCAAYPCHALQTAPACAASCSASTCRHSVELACMPAGQVQS
jgi:hypothetical protein